MVQPQVYTKPTGIHNNQRLHEINLLHQAITKLDLEKELETPRIAVCGDQSSGKSAWIRRVSGVHLPSATDTCTRAPTEIITTHVDDRQVWSCCISIRKEDGTSSTFAENVTKDLVQGQIIKAQKKLVGEDGDSRAINFSNDTIIVHVKASDVRNLVLVDLPGLIAPGEQDAELVEEMNLKAIQADEVLIVTVRSALKDSKTQLSQKLIKKVDPEGKRTIAAVTFCDRVSDGELESRLKFSAINARVRCRAAFYLINPEDQSVEPADALEQEREHFRNASEAAQEFYRQNDRLHYQGLNNMLTYVVGTLCTMFQEKLDRIREKIDSACTKLDLEMLPLPSDVDTSRLSALLKKGETGLLKDVGLLSNNFLSYRESFPHGEILAVKLKDIYGIFRRGILMSRPKCTVPISMASIGTRDNSSTEPLKYDFKELDTWGREEHPKDFTVTFADMHENVSTAAAPAASGLACPVVIGKTMLKYTSEWSTLAGTCLESVKTALVDVIVDELIKKHFPDFPALHDLLKQEVVTIVDQHANQTSWYLTKYIKQECGDERELYNINAFEDDYTFAWYNKFRGQVNKQLRELQEVNVGDCTFHIATQMTEANPANGRFLMGITWVLMTMSDTMAFWLLAALRVNHHLPSWINELLIRDGCIKLFEELPGFWERVITKLEENGACNGTSTGSQNTSVQTTGASQDSVPWYERSRVLALLQPDIHNQVVRREVLKKKKSGLQRLKTVLKAFVAGTSIVADVLQIVMTCV